MGKSFRDYDKEDHRIIKLKEKLSERAVKIFLEHKGFKVVKIQTLYRLKKTKEDGSYLHKLSFQTKRISRLEDGKKIVKDLKDLKKDNEEINIRFPDFVVQGHGLNIFIEVKSSDIDIDKTYIKRIKEQKKTLELLKDKGYYVAFFKVLLSKEDIKNKTTKELVDDLEIKIDQPKDQQTIIFKSFPNKK